MKQFNNRIVYIGPIGEPNKPQKGGYESANRRNIDALKKRGVHVEELAYSKRKIETKSQKLQYFFLISFFYKLIFLRFYKKIEIVHITPLYRHFLYFETFLVCWCHLLKFKVLLDLRAGAFVKYYNRRSILYKWLVSFLLKHSDIVTVESNSYKKFINNLFPEKPVFYFPNTSSKISKKSKEPTNRFNIIYFGRIAPSKGIDIIFKVMELLDNSFNLYLAGNIEDGYEIPKVCNKNIFYEGFLSFQQLEALLEQMHFFIFPTQHVGEGQSNSLIEAMSFGLVPLCSDNGFNKEVINKNGFVFPDNKPEDYYTAIMEIKNSRMFNTLSENCKRHIKMNHNLETEINKIIRYYECLGNGYPDLPIIDNLFNKDTEKQNKPAPTESIPIPYIE